MGWDTQTLSLRSYSNLHLKRFRGLIVIIKENLKYFAKRSSGIDLIWLSLSCPIQYTPTAVIARMPLPSICISPLPFCWIQILHSSPVSACPPGSSFFSPSATTAVLETKTTKKVCRASATPAQTTAKYQSPHLS